MDRERQPRQWRTKERRGGMDREKQPRQWRTTEESEEWTGRNSLDNGEQQKRVRNGQGETA